MPLYIKIIY